MSASRLARDQFWTFFSNQYAWTIDSQGWTKTSSTGRRLRVYSPLRRPDAAGIA